MLKRKLAPVFYVLPALLLLTVFIYYPIVRNLGYGFTNWNLMSNVKEWVGLEITSNSSTLLTFRRRC